MLALPPTSQALAILDSKKSTSGGKVFHQTEAKSLVAGFYQGYLPCRRPVVGAQFSQRRRLGHPWFRWLQMCRMATFNIGPFWVDGTQSPLICWIYLFRKVGLEFESISCSQGSLPRNAREVAFSKFVPVDVANTGARHLRRNLSCKDTWRRLV